MDTIKAPSTTPPHQIDTAAELLAYMPPSTLIDFIDHLWGLDDNEDTLAALTMAAQQLIALIGLDDAETQTGKDLYEILSFAGVY